MADRGNGRSPCATGRQSPRLPVTRHRPLTGRATSSGSFHRRKRRGARRTGRGRTSADDLRRQAGAADADDAGRRSGGAGDRLSAQPAAGRIASRHRCRASGLGDQFLCDQDAFRSCRSRCQDRQANQDDRLRPGHRVRRPDGGNRERPPARRRATLSQATLYNLLDRVRVHETIYKQAGAVHGCALASNEDDTVAHPHVRRGCRPPQRGRCDRRPDVARPPRRRRQDLLYDRPPDVRDGDQGRADGHPVSGVALRASRKWGTKSRRRSASR